MINATSRQVSAKMSGAISRYPFTVKGLPLDELPESSAFYFPTGSRRSACAGTVSERIPEASGRMMHVLILIPLRKPITPRNVKMKALGHRHRKHVYLC